MSLSVNQPFKRPRVVAPINLWNTVAQTPDLYTNRIANFSYDPKKPFEPPALGPWIVKEFEGLLDFKDLMAWAFVCKTFFASICGNPQNYNKLNSRQNPRLLQLSSTNNFSPFANLNVLDLSSNKQRRLGRKAALPLFLDKITCLNNLLTLKLCHNELGPTSLVPLTQLSRLTSLHLNEVDKIDSAFDTVLQLTGLRELVMSKAVLSTDKIDSISKLTQLIVFDISKLRRKMPFGTMRGFVESFAFVTSLTGLEVLNLSSNFQDNQAIPSLSSLASLSTLIIRDNDIGDNVVQFMLPSSLRILDARGVKISRQMLAHLNKSNKLVVLN